MGIASRLNPTAAVGTAPARVRDASNRVLEVGDEILVLTPKQIMRVASITPIMHPGAPPNMMLLTLVTKLAIAVPRDTGVEDLYFLRHQAEIGDKAIPGAEHEPSGADGPEPRDEAKE